MFPSIPSLSSLLNIQFNTVKYMKNSVYSYCITFSYLFASDASVEPIYYTIYILP